MKWKDQSYCGNTPGVDPQFYDTPRVPGDQRGPVGRIVKKKCLEILCPSSCPVKGHCALDALVHGTRGLVVGGVAVPDGSQQSRQKTHALAREIERSLCRVINERSEAEGLPSVNSRREALNLQGEYQ